LTVSI